MLKKPIIYIDTDLESYKQNRGIMFDNLEFWTPGFKVNTIEYLLKSIPLCFRNDYPYKNELKTKSKLWFGNKKNGGCKEICNYIFTEKGINNQLQIYKAEEDLLQEELYQKEEIIKLKDEKIVDLEYNLNQIWNSKSWKICKKAQEIKVRIFNIFCRKNTI